MSFFSAGAISMRTASFIVTLVTVAGCSSSQTQTAGCPTSECADIGTARDLGFSFSDDGNAARDGDVPDLGNTDLISAPDLSDVPLKWTRQDVGLTVAASIWASDAHSVFVAGGPEGVIHSVNEGATWDLQVLPAMPPLKGIGGIWGLDKDNLFAVGAAGNHDAIYRTTNAGKTWDFVIMGTQVGLNSIGAQYGAQTIFTAGEYDELLISTDGGKMWNAGSPPPQVGKGDGWNSILVGSGGTIWMASAGGPGAGVFRSDNSGMTWTDQTPPMMIKNSETKLWGIGDELWAVPYWAGTNLCGQIFHSTNGGMTWTDQSANAPQIGDCTYHGIGGADTGDVYIVGGPQVLLHSKDHGQHWVQELPPGHDGLLSVWANSRHDVYIGGRNAWNTGKSVGLIYHGQ